MKWIGWLKKAYFIAKTVWPIMKRLIELKRANKLGGLELVVHQSDISVVPNDEASGVDNLVFNVDASLQIEVLFHGATVTDAVKAKVREDLARTLKEGLHRSHFDNTIKRFKV